MVSDGGGPPCPHLMLSVVAEGEMGGGQGGQGTLEPPRASGRGWWLLTPSALCVRAMQVGPAAQPGRLRCMRVSEGSDRGGTRRATVTSEGSQGQHQSRLHVCVYACVSPRTPASTAT